MLQRTLLSLINCAAINKRLTVSGIRCISSASRKLSTSSSSALKSAKSSNGKNSVSSSKLLRSLTAEIEAQREVSQDQAEEFDPQSVLKEFSGFLNKGSWTLEHDLQNSTQVTLKRRDDTMQADISLKFDLTQVFNEIYDLENSEFDQEEEEEEDYEEEEEEVDEIKDENEQDIHDEIDEDLEFAALPFVMEIQRDSIPGKTLLFDCITEGNTNESEICLQNVSIRNNNNNLANYVAPNYEHLDEELQNAFSEYARKLVGSPEQEKDLFTFIKSYSVAAESRQYSNWLNEVKDMIKTA
jgi:hypothetical protein